MKREDVDKILGVLNQGLSEEIQEIFEMFNMSEAKEIFDKMYLLEEEGERLQEHESPELEKCEQELEKCEQELEILLHKLFEKIEGELGKDNESYFYQNVSTQFFEYLKNEKQKIFQVDRMNEGLIRREKIFEKIEKLSDEEKLELFSNVKSGTIKRKIIERIKDDEVTIRALPYIKDRFWKMEIISKIEDFHLRDMYYVEMLQDRSGLRNNSEVQVLISRISEPKIKDNQIMQILYDEELEKIRPDLLSERDKDILIAKIQDYDLQKEQILKSLNSVKILCYMSDPQRAIDMLDIVEKKKDKYQVVQSILEKDISYADLLAEKMNDNNIKNIAQNSWEQKRERKLDAIGLPPEMSIGIEIEAIEFEETYSHLLMNQSIYGIAKGRKFYNYFAKYEESSDIEVTSPILHDNEQDVTSIYDVCETLNDLGYGVSKNCGAHVHIGLDYLDSRRAIENVYEIWGGTGEILHKICNENGKLPRSNVYAQPYSGQFSVNLEKLPLRT